jgi:RNA polymerase sigma-70 factor (ECF subfamily)
MTAPEDTDTERLLEQASQGDVEACQRLLQRHRRRLKQMIALRLDPRVAARIDPSDVVQEALLEAFQRLPGYLAERPLPFYPWLRALAWERLIDLHRRHLKAKRRSVIREEEQAPPLPDASALVLAERLVARGSSPSAGLRRREACDRVRQALGLLSETDREVLVLRHLEQLSVGEVAAVLGIREGAVSVRHLRALRRLRDMLGDDLFEDLS